MLACTKICEHNSIDHVDSIIAPYETKEQQKSKRVIRNLIPGIQYGLLSNSYLAIVVDTCTTNLTSFLLGYMLHAAFLSEYLVLITYFKSPLA